MIVKATMPFLRTSKFMLLCNSDEGNNEFKPPKSFANLNIPALLLNGIYRLVEFVKAHII